MSILRFYCFHQLFVDYGVNIFIHGHDHLFVKQELDGVIYQLAPQPSLFNYTGDREFYRIIR